MSISLEQLRKAVQKANPALRIYSINDSYHTPASIVRYGHEDEPICAVPKKEIPEYSQFDSRGYLKDRGWRQTVAILSGQRLVDGKKLVKYIQRIGSGMVI